MLIESRKSDAKYPIVYEAAFCNREYSVMMPVAPRLMQLSRERDSIQDSMQVCNALQGLKQDHKNRNCDGSSANCSLDFPPNLIYLSPATVHWFTHTPSQKIARNSQNVW